MYLYVHAPVICMALDTLTGFAGRYPTSYPRLHPKLREGPRRPEKGCCMPGLSPGLPPAGCLSVWKRSVPVAQILFHLLWADGWGEWPVVLKSPFFSDPEEKFKRRKPGNACVLQGESSPAPSPPLQSASPPRPPFSLQPLWSGRPGTVHTSP